MNEEYNHLRHAVRIQIISIENQIESLKQYKVCLESFSSQMDNYFKKE